jgi:hypothetical protein
MTELKMDDVQWDESVVDAMIDDIFADLGFTA